MKRMMKFVRIHNFIYAFANAIIRMLLIMITAGLCLQSMFSTSFIGKIVKEDGGLQERTLNIADRPWEHLLVFLIFTAAMVSLRMLYQFRIRAGQQGSEDMCAQHTVTRDGNRILWGLSGIALIAGTIWILVTQLEPGSDPAKVYEIAMQWRKGNFSSYAEGGYLFRYPFQAGIVFFYYLLSFLFGMYNYMGLQFVNVIALVTVFVLLVKLSALFWKEDKKLPVVVYIVLIMWVPISFYVTYLYGILPGMALSLGAVYSTAKYIDTGKYSSLFLAGVCMGLATVIKMNCLIYYMAISCFLLYHAIDSVLLKKRESYRRGAAALAAIVFMGLSIAGCNRIVERCVEHISGYEAGEGEAMVSWIVMGLQETPLGPGGYSGYIGDVFVRCEYDTEKITEESIGEIKKILTRMSENVLDDGITFFARKNAFQWNDPTFISLDRTRGRISAIAIPDSVSSLIEGRGSVGLSIVLNYMQTLLLVGFLLYQLLNWRSRNLYELMGAVVFLGGYLFHFIWESSASYTIPYFVVMIPYAVKGLMDWIRYAMRLPEQIRADRNSGEGIRGILYRNQKRLCLTGFIMALLLLLSSTNLFQNTIALDDGETARVQFYREDMEGIEYETVLQDGYFYVSPASAPDMGIAEQDGDVTVVSIEEDVSNAETDFERGKQAVMPVSAVEDISRKVLLTLEKSSGSAVNTTGICMRFRSNEQVLAVQKQETMKLTVYMDDGMNMFYKPDTDIYYLWQFQQADGGGYYICVNDMALTYRNGKVILEEWDGNEEQRWQLQK